MRHHINSYGTLNLKTGKYGRNSVLDDAWQHGTIVVLQVGDKTRAVAGYQACEIGQQIRLQSADNDRHLGTGKVIGSYPCTTDGIKQIAQLTGAKTIRFATWDSGDQ